MQTASRRLSTSEARPNLYWRFDMTTVSNTTRTRKLLPPVGANCGQWVVVDNNAGKTSYGARLCLVRCSCGTERLVISWGLVSGKSTSCGCVGRAKLVARNTTHGYAPRGANSPEYRAWARMIQRVDNPTLDRWSSYGGRGIRVCDRWRESFEAFLVDMGPRPNPKHSVDRINVDGDYEPENCRWASPTVQARNTRRNHYVIVHGSRMCITEAAERLGIPYATVKWRIRHGMTDEQALGISQD